MMSCGSPMRNIFLNKYFILLCGLDFTASYALSDGSSVSSSIDHLFTLNSIYYKTYKINITNLSPETRAIEFHAISQGGIVFASLQNSFSEEETTKGLSAGVIALLQANHTVFKIFYLKVFPSKNCSANYSERILVSALSLNSKQPLPGACNLVHSANYYPLLSVSTNDHLVEVAFSPSNVGYSFSQKEPPKCDASNSPNRRLIYNVYVHFLSYSYKNETCSNCESFSSCSKKTSPGYFNQELSQIITNEAENVGTKIKTIHQHDKPYFTLPIVPCSSVVIYITVVDPTLNTTSKYIPEIVFNGQRIDDAKYKIFVKVCLAFLIVVGFALCFAGHRYFLFELFAFGGIILSLLSYITFALCDPSSDVLSLSWKWAIICVSTLLGGFLFCGLWWRFDHHILFSQLISFVGGFLFSCIIFITPFANLSFFGNGIAFAISVVIGMMVYNLSLTLVSRSRMCVITSAFVGSFVVVASLGCGVFLCSMMSQIVELMLFKITVKHFIKSTIVVPLQTNDYALIGGWVALFICGCAVQFYLLRSHPKFPECPYRARRTRPVPQRLSSSSTSSGPETMVADSDSLASHQSSCTSANYDGDVSDGVELEVDGVISDTAQLLSFSDE